METIGTSCYTSNFNYVGYSPYSSSSGSSAFGSCSYTVNDDNYDIKPFDQYPYVVGANGVVSNTFFIICYSSKHTVMTLWRYILSS